MKRCRWEPIGAATIVLLMIVAGCDNRTASSALRIGSELDLAADALGREAALREEEALALGDHREAFHNGQIPEMAERLSLPYLPTDRIRRECGVGAPQACYFGEYEAVLHLGSIRIAGEDAVVDVLLSRPENASMTLVHHLYRRNAAGDWAWTGREEEWTFDT